MKQVRNFDRRKAGTMAYWCLRNVRMGYSIAPLYDDAWTAWTRTQQHKNRTIPAGVDVPLFYSFTATIGGVRKNWGHINVRLKDGRVWNDGKIFASLVAFERAFSNVSYVGWGESVNNVEVIEEDTVSKNLLSEHGQNVLERFYLGRDTPERFRSRVGRDEFDVESERKTSSVIYANIIKRASEGKLDPKNHLPTAIRSVFVNPLQKDLTTATRSLAKANEQFDAIAKKLADKTEELNDQIDQNDARKEEMNILYQDVEDLRVEVTDFDEENTKLQRRNTDLELELGTSGELTAWQHFQLGIKKLLGL